MFSIISSLRNDFNISFFENQSYTYAYLNFKHQIFLPYNFPIKLSNEISNVSKTTNQKKSTKLLSNIFQRLTIPNITQLPRSIEISTRSNNHPSQTKNLKSPKFSLKSFMSFGVCQNFWLADAKTWIFYPSKPHQKIFIT